MGRLDAEDREEVIGLHGRNPRPTGSSEPFFCTNLEADLVTTPGNDEVLLFTLGVVTPELLLLGRERRNTELPTKSIGYERAVVWALCRREVLLGEELSSVDLWLLDGL